MNMTLKRVVVLPDGAFGVLLCDGIPFAVTLEHTYLNAGTISTKIGNGEFHVTRSRFNKGGYDTFEIEVPGHSRILFHKGNSNLDSDGCVLVGEQFGVLHGKPAILQSGEAFKEFLILTADHDAFQLTVI